MLTIGKPFGIWFSTRATLARSTSIDGREPSPGAFGLVRKFSVRLNIASYQQGRASTPFLARLLVAAKQAGSCLMFAFYSPTVKA